MGNLTFCLYVVEQGLQAFIPTVENQLVLGIQRIHMLGVRKIAVAGLQPLGCLPTATLRNGFRLLGLRVQNTRAG